MAAHVPAHAPIQAKSLSSLNELADNPPTHLTPSMRRDVRGTLVLYIVRVPGSRDVFLTTMKPGQKVVSAQDVESCLYYCHLETAADAAIRASLQSEEQDEVDHPASHGLLHPPSPRRRSQEPEEVAPPLPVRRPTDPVPASTDFEGPMIAVGAAGSERQTISRKPVGGEPHRQSFQKEPSPSRRPLGPRPMAYHPPSMIASEQVLAERGKENLPPPAYHPTAPVPMRPPHHNSQPDNPPIVVSTNETDRPVLPPRQNTGEWFPSSPPSHISRAAVPPPLPLRRGAAVVDDMERRDSSSASSAESFVEARDFQVTVIRRDPVTGGQWNIGRLTKDSTGSGKGNDGNKKVEMEISSGGYDKFVTAEDEDEAEQEHVASNSGNSPAFAYVPFRRELHLQRRKTPRTPASPDSPLKRAPTSNAPANAPFSFTSPWYGACDFTTGLAGRNMRCRHTHPLPGNSGSGAASFEPKLALLNSAAVSDLRFNLPLLRHRQHASKDPASRYSHRASRSANASRSSFFPSSSSHATSFLPSSPNRLSAAVPPSLPPRPPQSHHRAARSADLSLGPHAERVEEAEELDDWDEAYLEPTETMPFDLSLGLERAGGGIAGNKAKLGKLVVEGDGLLMLDLVVLANMGIWWAVTTR